MMKRWKKGITKTDWKKGFVRVWLLGTALWSAFML
jgi:hypothetical protein